MPAVPDGELRRIRARFLAEAGWGTTGTIRAELERRDAVLAEAFAAGRPVVLWFEHDLYDQLQLIQVLSQCPGRPELIVVGAFEGRPDFHGLGELSADELETLWPLRSEAGDGALELARTAWDAFRSPDPRDVERLAAGDTGALPFLGAAFRRLLEELPSPGNGLSGTERPGAPGVAAGACAPAAAFVGAQRLEEAPFLGDAVGPPSPLCARAGDEQADRDRGRCAASPRRRRSATASASHASSCGSQQGERIRCAARPTGCPAPRHRPLDRGHPRHTRPPLALGRERPEAHPAMSALSHPDESAGTTCALRPASQCLRKRHPSTASDGGYE